MKIVRIQSVDGHVCFASQNADGSLERLQGSLFDGLTSTDQRNVLAGRNPK